MSSTLILRGGVVQHRRDKSNITQIHVYATIGWLHMTRRAAARSISGDDQQRAEIAAALEGRRCWGQVESCFYGDNILVPESTARWAPPGARAPTPTKLASALAAAGMNPYPHHASLGGSPHHPPPGSGSAAAVSSNTGPPGSGGGGGGGGGAEPPSHHGYGQAPNPGQAAAGNGPATTPDHPSPHSPPYGAGPQDGPVPQAYPPHPGQPQGMNSNGHHHAVAAAQAMMQQQQQQQQEQQHRQQQQQQQQYGQHPHLPPHMTGYPPVNHNNNCTLKFSLFWQCCSPPSAAPPFIHELGHFLFTLCPTPRGRVDSTREIRALFRDSRHRGGRRTERTHTRTQIYIMYVYVCIYRERRGPSASAAAAAPLHLST
uniref:Uncharacterized protein n=1 Tax=Trichogramma kaykai TaxID=54128 RepID=A0ABD2X502_9HYME